MRTSLALVRKAPPTVQISPVRQRICFFNDALFSRRRRFSLRITNQPPEQAFGRKVADSPLAVAYLDNRPAIDWWIALDYGPTLAPLLHARPAFRSNSLSIVADALRRGQGIGPLPCFVGETTEGLVRVPDIPLKPDMEIWVLTHEDVRDNPRVRALMDHLYQVFSKQRGMIEGLV